MNREAPGWANIEREDANDHAIDQAGNLIHDPRCYFCADDDDQRRAWIDYLALTAGGGSR